MYMKGSNKDYYKNLYQNRQSGAGIPKSKSLIDLLINRHMENSNIVLVCMFSVHSWNGAVRTLYHIKQSEFTKPLYAWIQ